MNQKTVYKFLARVSDEPTEDGCLLWTGAIHCRKGYGYLRVDGKNVLAHRLAWEIVNGSEAPPDMCVCHKCDTPACVLGSHLFLGTRADNNADCVSKGRNARGSKHGRARLTEASVVAIRELCAAGAKTKDLAKQFGVALRTIQYVVSRKRQWKHIE